MLMAGHAQSNNEEYRGHHHSITLDDPLLTCELVCLVLQPSLEGEQVPLLLILPLPPVALHGLDRVVDGICIKRQRCVSSLHKAGIVSED